MTVNCFLLLKLINLIKIFIKNNFFLQKHTIKFIAHSKNLKLKKTHSNFKKINFLN